MKLQKKSYSRVSLTSLLKRKRSNLSNFLSENGIISYELLKIRCQSMGVLPPSQQEFQESRGANESDVYEVSSPTEGIVVIPPVSNEVISFDQETPLIEESSGKLFQSQNISEKSEIDSNDELNELSQQFSKKNKKKK